eukprot:scaffold30083_cov99-Amphora_coffeaeformis.AAC.1
MVSNNNNGVHSVKTFRFQCRGRSSQSRFHRWGGVSLDGSRTVIKFKTWRRKILHRPSVG